MSILVIGDSFCADDDRWRVWPYLIGDRTGERIVNRAMGGSGYNMPGVDPTKPSRFSRQLNILPQSDVDLVIFFGSCNDRYSNKDVLRLWIQQTHLLAMRMYPTARQLIVSPQWAGTDPVPSDVIDARTALTDAMWAYDWKYPNVDPIAENWFPQGDLAPLRTDDHFHPNAQGHIRIADKLESHVKYLISLGPVAHVG